MTSGAKTMNCEQIFARHSELCPETSLKIISYKNYVV